MDERHNGARFRMTELLRRLGGVEDGQTPSRGAVYAIAERLGLGTRRGATGHRYFTDDEAALIRSVYEIRNRTGRNMETVLWALCADPSELVEAEEAEKRRIEEFYAEASRLRNRLVARRR